MINQKYKVFVFAFLLLSTTLIPSSNLAYAESTILVVDSTNSPYVVSTPEEFNSVIVGSQDDTSAGKIIIESGGKLTVTTTNSQEGLVIFNDGELLIETSGELIVVGSTINRGTILIDGIFEPIGVVLFGSGNIVERCGHFELSGITASKGVVEDIPCEDGSNEIFLQNLTVEKNKTFTIADHEVLFLSGEVLIIGILENFGILNNLSDMAREGGLIKNAKNAEIIHLCANFGISKISGDGGLQNEGIIRDTECFAPHAEDDFYSTDEDISLLVDGIDILGVLDNDNDLDTDQSELIVSADTLTKEDGTVFMNNDGTFEYIPDENFFGLDEFEYRLDDGTGGFDTAIVKINVISLNDKPIASDDDLIINEDDGSIDITSLVLDNDIDFDNSDILSIVGAEDQLPALGTVTVGSLIYDTDSKFESLELGESVMDKFDYTISDETETSSAFVTVTVNGQNDAPVAGDDMFTLNQAEDKFFAVPGVLLNDDDVDNNYALTLELLSQPERAGEIPGEVKLFNDGSLVYTSSLTSAYGFYDFEYQVTDEHGATDNAIVTLEIIQTIFPDEVPPTIIAPPAVIAEASGIETPSSEINLGTPIVSDNVDPNPAISVVIPPTFLIGDTTITWTATDASGNSAESDQLVTIEDTTAPTIIAPSDIEIDSTTPISNIDLGTPTVSDIVDENPIVSNDAPSEFPFGTTTVTWTATDVSGNSNESIQTILINEISENLREDKLDLINQLEQLTTQAQDKKTTHELEKAIKHLNKSTEENRWEDSGNYLTEDKGDKVFKDQKKGIKHILTVLEKGKESATFILELSYIALGLIEVDEELSLNAFIQATESGDDFDSKKAENEFNKAQNEIAKTKLDKAVDHFLKSWQASLGIEKKHSDKGHSDKGPGKK